MVSLDSTPSSDQDRTEAAARVELSAYARRLVENRLVVGPGGNISVRCGQTMLVSPSGFDLAAVEPDHWVPVEVTSGAFKGNLRPSSELAMHLEAYRRRLDVVAVVHTHPVNCIALTLVADELPVLFPDQAALIDHVSYIDYVLPTTEAMARAVGEEVSYSSAVLLGNHGLVTTGKSLRQAYYRTQVMEAAAEIYLLARSVGEPRVLSSHEVEEVRGLDAEAYRVQLSEE